MLSPARIFVFAVLVAHTTVGLRPLDPEQIKLLTAVYDAYVAQNLSYDCFRYADHNSVAECDCLACVNAQPDFVHRMCSFRQAQEKLQETELASTSRGSNNVWKAICDQKCGSRVPSRCCDPAVSRVPFQQGCPTCLPTRESGSTVGQHPSCVLAETDASKRPSGLNWLERYSRFVAAMDRAQLSRKCISYALVRNANPCDCKPCLESEGSTRALREKFCEYGRLVRATKELVRPDFWGNNDYFLKFCDFETCPDMPRKCCTPHDGGDSNEGRYPVDGKGCPVCLPTSELFGFGPRCQRKFQRLPAAVRDRLVARL
ncbi:hypothetical protein BIW11_10537 [Tropilaelaps mercedesae]|uniref:Uncharacterized protein n=1 Tax=Tropilaelaps mercedesae TaxID=418985 RepID=A0A1V9XFQ8_9ACAR|nr:hypothetical protein BIW11_10537 [Tropilaelaps mercedesae]